MLYFHLTILLLAVSTFAAPTESDLDDLIGTEIQKCINCLCHARSGCWSRINCARYSISMDYWKSVNGPRVNSQATESEDDAYSNCMKDENCILNTVNRYTEQFGDMDCNTDGAFNCKDRLAVHLFGKNCINPRFGTTYSNRFNDCAETVGVPFMLPFESFGVPDAV